MWGGGGHSGTEWLPTAIWMCGAEAVNANIFGWSASFGAQNGGGILQTKNLLHVILS